MGLELAAINLRNASAHAGPRRCSKLARDAAIPSKADTPGRDRTIFRLPLSSLSRHSDSLSFTSSAKSSTPGSGFFLAAGNYTRFLEKLQQIKILILDDLGISPLTQEQTGDIMEIILARDLCASTVVTTQFPKDKIDTAFADPILAGAICTRLFRGAIDITLKGEFRRKASPPKS